MKCQSQPKQPINKSLYQGHCNNEQAHQNSRCKRRRIGIVQNTVYLVMVFVNGPIDQRKHTVNYPIYHGVYAVQNSDRSRGQHYIKYDKYCIDPVNADVIKPIKGRPLVCWHVCKKHGIIYDCHNRRNDRTDVG